MFRIIKNNIFLTLLLAIGVLLAVINYTPGTFLSGWDTLHPEFNFGLAFQREINGVFRPEQGLGAVAAHSHMADLPHTTILYLFSFILPTSFLRYSYIFLDLIAGPIGMYLFLNRWVIKNKFASFLGSLFYLLNLGTMQMFIVPFEMFTTQYALLPWLFLFATEYLYAKQKPVKKLLFFSAATLLATPTAYAATLWYVYFLIFIAYLVSLNLFDRSRAILKKSVMLALITLAINSFWILPNVYFVLNHGQAVSGALINQLFSPQAFLYNKEFGNFPDIALMKNFLFDWNVYGGKGNFIPLLSPWISHLNQKPVELIGFLFALIAFAGILSGALKKNKILISLFFPLLLCLFFLINDNPPTSFLYNFLGDKIPFFKEAFRFPDDKVLGIFTFLFALYFAQGQKIIIDKIKKFRFVYLIIFLLLITYYMLPAFAGNLISPYMRIAIPQDYFKMFDWFKTQDESARVANLPIHSVYGWKYHSWSGDGKPGFQGADFLQFGIPQPLLDRDFDRWSPYNEQYYREMSEAIYSQNSLKLASVLKKYEIRYVLLDRSVIAPEQKLNPQVLFFREINNLLARDASIRQVFNSGSLFVYKVNLQNQEVRTIKNPLSVWPAPAVFYDDFAYLKYNDYVTYADPQKNTIIYPYRNIINNQNLVLSDIASSFPQIAQNRYEFFPSSSTNDCPSSAPESSGKMQILEDISGRFLRYSSTSEPLCNHYSFPIIPREQGYLISVASRNVSGLPLKLCVANYISKRCDLLTQLSSSPILTKESFLLPPMEKGVGFDLNFNSFTIKNSPAVNDLYSVEISLFPYTESSQIEQYNPDNSFKDVSVLVSSQAFEKGWKAFEAASDKRQATSWLTNMFPFFFGKELKEHILVNSWANGWILDSHTPSAISNKLIIIFWPQYLEYLGFLILGGTFATILIIYIRKTGDY